jgi:hypothetical protein
VPDFEMLDLGRLFAIEAYSDNAHEWMKRVYQGYDPLRGKVLHFDIEGLQGFIQAISSHGLTIEGVKTHEIY